MTDPFDELLVQLGVTLETAILTSGSRGIAIGRRGEDRVLAAVVGPDVDPGALREVPGWDLPLGRVEEVETDNGRWTVIAESLPTGIPSTSPGLAGERRALGSGPPFAVPPFAIELARRVAATHDAGELVGPIQPALVFVDPESRSLAGIAQRPLRADAAAAYLEGAPRFFGAAFLTPGEIRAQPPSPEDDVFRLAALAWRWRHGRDPFAGDRADRLARTLTGTPTTPGVGDGLDTVLLAAFGPVAPDRPTAAELAVAFAAEGHRMLSAE